MKFFYQIKGKKSDRQENDGMDIWNSHWVWPPIFTGMVEADNRTAAIQVIHADYEKSFPTRILKKDLDANEFLLSVKEIADDDKYTLSLFDIRTCKQCTKQYKEIEKYNIGNPGGGAEFCSLQCSSIWWEVERQRRKNEYAINIDFEGMHPAVIYKITNKINGKCYIGKTTQAFTFRWYQHFFQSKKGTTFYDAVAETQLTDWLFEVIELVLIPDDIKTPEEIRKLILSRETFHIKANNSILNGYNSVVSLGTNDQKECDPDQIKILLE